MKFDSGIYFSVILLKLRYARGWCPEPAELHRTLLQQNERLNGHTLACTELESTYTIVS